MGRLKMRASSYAFDNGETGARWNGIHAPSTQKNYQVISKNAFLKAFKSDIPLLSKAIQGTFGKCMTGGSPTCHTENFNKV